MQSQKFRILLDSFGAPAPAGNAIQQIAAGAILVQDARLFRPSQNRTKTYGYGFDLNEMEAASASRCCERPRRAVRPDWDKKVLATHTYANRGRLTIIDAFTHVRRIG